MEESDGAVIAGSLETPGAFGVIFDRHGSTLLRFLARRVDPAEAEDLLGEVFRIAFERRSAFERDRDSARPWLYGIAANVVAKHYRSEARRSRAMARVSARRLLDEDPGRAESEGAQIVTPLEDMFWGDRRYEALDPEGHRWHFAERLSEIRP
jgi:RNA polymerase sigma-70 factor (ECF subfamily)